MTKTVNDSLALLRKHDYDGSKNVLYRMEERTQENKKEIYNVLGGYEKSIKVNVKNESFDINDNMQLWDKYSYPIYKALREIKQETPSGNKLTQLYDLLYINLEVDWLLNNKIDTNNTKCKSYFLENDIVYLGVNINNNLLNSKISKILEKIFPDVLKDYNALREWALKQRDLSYTLHLSINPYHFFKMSTDNDFRSCYTLNQGSDYNGCYHGGITPYINDNVTIVSYMTKDNDDCTMYFRQLLHVDLENKVVIIARPYPELPNRGYLKALRKSLRDLFFSDSNDDDVTYKFTDSAQLIKNRVSAPSGACYVDVAKGSYEGVSMTYPKDFDIDGYYMRIAHNDGTCIDCGDDFNESESLSCCKPRHGTKCEDCGGYHDEDDMYYIDNHGYVCDSCVDDYSYCDRCGERGHSDGDYQIVNTRHGEETWCESCHSEYASVCDDCGELFRNRDYNLSHTHDGNRICDDCMENYSQCDDCDELYHINELIPVNDGIYCESCAENQEEESEG